MTPKSRDRNNWKYVIYYKNGKKGRGEWPNLNEALSEVEYLISRCNLENSVSKLEFTNKRKVRHARKKL